MFLSTSLSTAQTWHRRLGNIHFADLNKISKGAVQGIQFSDKIEKQHCITCYEGKHSRYPFPNARTRSKDLLEIVHSDLCGPMEVSSIGRSRYFLIFEDDYSKMCFIYCIA